MQLRWPLLLMLVGGKTNIIRRLLRICTMSTSTVGWCNNCSFSAKKMHFGALARCAQGRSDGLGCSSGEELQARSVSSRLGSNGDGSLRSDSNVIWPALPSATLHRGGSMMWYDGWHCRVKSKIWARRPQRSLHAPQCFQESIYISENVECWWCDGGDLPPRSLIEIPKAVPGHSSLTPPEISEKIPKISKQISKL